MMAVEVKGPAQDQAAPSPANAGVRQESPCEVPSNPGTLSFLRIIIDLPPEAAKQFQQLIDQTGESPTEFFRKAISLYKLSKEAIQEGKFVGIAETEDSLETEFVGI
jgi:hypothetical protein